MLKKITIVLLSILIILSICNISMAGSAGGVFDDTARFDTTVDPNIEKTTKGFLGGAIDVVQIFSVGLAVILLIVNSIQYMNAAPDAKADIKKKMVLYGIGAVIVFSATQLAEIIFKFFEKNIQAS